MNIGKSAGLLLDGRWAVSEFVSLLLLIQLTVSLLSHLASIKVTFPQIDLIK